MDLFVFFTAKVVMAVVNHVIMYRVDILWRIVTTITQKFQNNNPMGHMLSSDNDESNTTPLYLLINICASVTQIYSIEGELSRGYLIPLFVGSNLINSPG